MRAAFVALAAFALSFGVVVACSDETGTVTPDEGGTEGGIDPESGADAGYDGPDPSMLSPTGCLLRTTDFQAGAKAENVARTDIQGAVDWENVEGALAEDGDLATVTLDDGQESAELRVSQFGFNLPDSVETWGIEVQLKRRAPDGGIEDARVDLDIEGKQVGWKYVKGPWPTSIIGTHHYGQKVDTWRVDLYPADVNKETFAAKLWVRKSPDAGPGPVVAQVDSLKVAVWYCPEPNVRYPVPEQQ
mgnify:CR=1 FL=1